MKLKVGDRVTADVGAGPQAGKIVGRWALGYMVLFDVAPPREYNMGENPTAMLPYWCDEHSGFHLGHWTSHGQRARHFWGTEIYNRINRYYRVHRPHHDKSQ